MTGKVGGFHPKVLAVGIHPEDCTPSLSSYVYKRLIRRQNSQILRRPQDDRRSGLCHPKVIAGGCSAMHQQRPMPCKPPHHCHPMFANDSSEGRTARSFGGLRMTEKVGVCHPKVVAGGCSAMHQKGLCHVNHPIIVILRPPKDLAVFVC
jgi:hypothetical protein